jgi:hypothetical protein
MATLCAMTRRSARAALASAVLALAVVPTAASASTAFPMQLPGDASAARVQASSSTWIVGARPGATATALARRFGARVTGPAGTGGYVLAKGRARAFAGALRRSGALVYAQPDVLRQHKSMPMDPFDSTYTWRKHIVDPSLTPPAVTPSSPLIALVDAAADVNHPELVGHTTTLPNGPPVVNPHGTGTASVASASANGVGFSGVWPGARTLNVPLDENITCSESANGIAHAIKAGASVINMSYGSSVPCVPETTALQYAVGRGIVPVAAAGNEFQEGNPLEFPASLPHVMTVGAITESEKPAYFSNANVALDVVAPGVGIPIAVPPNLDPDGDGYEIADGTSFSAPMVTAAIAWLRAARPGLYADQAANLLRFTARDLGAKGYDDTTGYGVIDLAKALTGKAGLHDPGEPNDDIPWVDGTMFAKPDPVIFKGKGKPSRLVASVDRVEDPADVYRVKVLGHRKVHVVATPLFGHITLLAYRPDAKRLSQTKRRVARSARPGNHVERVTIVNRSSRARTFFVAIDVPSGRLLNATYRLSVKR